jgi:alpha-L-rhamnosidase
MREQQQSPTTRIRVTGLRVNHLDRPLGMQDVRPHFSWRLESDERGVYQSAYRVLVASDPDRLEAGRADLWDSGKVVSPDCLSIPYRGHALQSRQRCFWAVRVWDDRGQPALPSEISWWELGLLSADDWQAQWIVAEDAIARADRETPLHWMWGEAQADHRPEVRQFRLWFDLPQPTRGGLFFAAGRSSFERIVDVCLDGAAIAVSAPGCDLTGENVQLGPLLAGRHLLVVRVHRANPWPEHFGQLPLAGIALLARFDTLQGQAFRVASAPSWQTSSGGSWDAVVTAALTSYLIREPAMQLRRTFSVEKNVATSRLYVSALGCYEARLNSQRVGADLLTPEISQYDKRVLYQTYDVRGLIRRGINALACTVGDGWYASHPGRYAWGPPPRRLLAQLELVYEDGTRDTVVTDPGWRIARSPILQSEICIGEIYDARLEQQCWDTAGFDDASWSSAQPSAPLHARLAAQDSPPIRATQVLRCTAITSPLSGVHVFDFGQNFAGWCRLRVKGERGTRIDLRFAEQVRPDGQVDQFSLNGRKAVDSYFLRGDPAGETFEPRFTYHGFRYVQVTGLPQPPSADTLEGIVIHNDLVISGQLCIDHPLIEKLWRSIVWTQRSNFIAVGTDCCNRAERMGYFLDMGVFWEAATFNMDVAAFTRRQLDNARDRQSEAGALPSLAPAPDVYVIYRFADGTATPGWGDGIIAMAWTCWRRYGDRRVLEQNWEAMNRHLTFILERNPSYLWLSGRGPDLGDWLAVDEQHFMRPEIPPTTPLDLFATAHWARSAKLLADIADVLGRSEDARRLRVVHENVRQAFIDAYVSPEGQVGNGSQTSCLLSLEFGLVPDALRKRVVEHLVQDIRERGCALSTGLFGTQYILDALADAGFAELACTLLLRRENPSWGYMIEHGATTIWERWDGSLDRKHLTASHNHPALGSVGSFLFRRLAAIEEAAPGFQRIRVRPLLDSRLQRGGGAYDSAMGRISTSWSYSPGGIFALQVSIPANCVATIHLPMCAQSCIREGTVDIEQRTDVRMVSRSSDEAIVEIGSGHYTFVIEPQRG